MTHFYFVQLIYLFSQPTSFPDQPTNHGLAAVLLAKVVKVMEPLYQQNS